MTSNCFIVKTKFTLLFQFLLAQFQYISSWLEHNFTYKFTYMFLKCFFVPGNYNMGYYMVSHTLLGAAFSILHPFLCQLLTHQTTT